MAGIRDDGCRRVMGVMSQTSGQAMQGGEGKLNMSEVVWMWQQQGAEW